MTTYTVDALGADFTSINAAMAAATAGDTIQIFAGTCNENVNVNKSLTLVGTGNSTIIQGNFLSDNGIAAGQVDTFVQTAPSYLANAGNGITVAADNVTIQDLAITAFNARIELGTNDGLTVQNVDISDMVNGVRKGAAAVVTNFKMIDGTIHDGYIGMNVADATNGAGDFSNVDIGGTNFHDLTEKGIYVEQLSNAAIHDITMTSVGEYGRGPAFGGTGPNAGEFGAGIDVNLKYENYSNITIEDFTFTNVGHSYGGDVPPGLFGGAILLKQRDDTPNYASPPASLDDLTVQNGTIDGTSVGIRTGEPGKLNAGITNLTITNVDIDNASVAEYDNRTPKPREATGTTCGDVMRANPVATSQFIFHGDAGNDTLDGAGGNDTVDYSGAAGPVVVDLGAGTATVDGTDTLSNIENAVGTTAGDTITGDGGVNVIDGGDSNDVIHGGAGIDTLLGGIDDDRLWGEAGADMLDGGTSDDHAYYENSTPGVQVDLNNAGPRVSSGDASGDVLISIESVHGATGFDNVLIGTSTTGERLKGGNFDDTITGNGGTGGDYVDAQAGDDILIFNTGDVVAGATISGGLGSDT